MYLNPRHWMAVLAPLALAGCIVPKQVVDHREGDIAACLGEIETTYAQVFEAEAQLELLCPEGDTDTCLEAQDEQLAELATCRAELVASAQAEPEPEPDAAVLVAEAAELGERLAGDIASQSVTIESGESQLAVRVLDSVLFNSGDTVLLAAGQALLDRVAPVLIAGRQPVRIEGHTDDIPIGPRLNTRYYSNWELSAARASAVVRYFQIRHGMAPERLQAVGLAQYYPAAPNDTPEGRQRNRRVEIILTPAES